MTYVSDLTNFLTAQLDSVGFVLDDKPAVVAVTSEHRAPKLLEQYLLNRKVDAVVSVHTGQTTYYRYRKNTPKHINVDYDVAVWTATKSLYPLQQAKYQTLCLQVAAAVENIFRLHQVYGSLKNVRVDDHTQNNCAVYNIVFSVTKINHKS